MGLSLAERVAELQPATRKKLLGGLTDGQIEDLLFDWDFWARMRNVKAKLVITDRVLSRYFFSDFNKSRALAKVLNAGIELL